MRILVVAPSWIGDTVAAQPLLARLKVAHPGVIIDVLAPAWVAQVLRHMPQVSEVIDSPFGHGQLQLPARRRLARELAARGYDEAVVLPNSWKSALIPFFARIPQRVGYLGEARFGLINRRHRLDETATPQIAERYAQLAQPPGTPLQRPLETPRLSVDESRRLETLAELGLAGDHAPVVFCPGAEFGPAKRWPAEHFAALARQLVARGHSVWLLGSPKDLPIGEQIAAAAGAGCRNLCARSSLSQAIDLLASAVYVVTNDSGLMHVAAALDRPMVALFGSSSPRFTPPLSERADVVWLELECSPCFKRECPLGHFKCLNDLTPERVLGEMEGMLR